MALDDAGSLASDLLMDAASAPLVRVVVLSFDGGQMTLDCLDSLLAGDWPAGRLQIVLIDNGSLDDVADQVRSGYPQVTLLEPLRNLGFAGGCNLGIRLAGDHDYVALVNNDATVSPDWLRPLVAAASSAPDVGAVSAKMLFADRFLGVDLDVPSACSPNRHDPRTLGVHVSGVRLDGSRDDGRVTFDEGFHGPEAPNVDKDEELARWSKHRGSVRITADADLPMPTVISLRLSCAVPREATLTTDAQQQTVQVGPQAQWFELRLGREPYDVINNVGSSLFRGGFGGDRGFLERDTGQYEEPAEVFAWCGGAVLLDRAYLDDVGLFDERLFLYYEDTDLSWRGRLRGWRYLYEPTSVVRHRHASSSGVGSPTFRFHTERNRLLVLVKNAPARVAWRAGLGEARRFAVTMWSSLVRRPLRLQMPERVESGHRYKVFSSYLRLLPAMLSDRWRGGNTVSRRALMRWEVTK